jgi:hypothetical protein
MILFPLNDPIGYRRLDSSDPAIQIQAAKGAEDCANEGDESEKLPIRNGHG